MKIGCGKLLKVGIDEKKEYFYGKIKFSSNTAGIGIFENDKIFTTGIDVYDFPFPAKENMETSKIIQNICNGNFILNMKTGEYKSGLSDENYKKELQSKNIDIKEENIEHFLKRKGKKKHNFEDIEEWMSTRLS